MALAKTVTKVFPTLDARGIFTVGIHLTLTDDNRPDLGAGEQIVIDEDITDTYKDGSNVQPIIDIATERGQEKIDNYKAERALNDKAAYTNAVNTVNTNLQV